MAVIPKDLGEVVTAGDDYAFTITLTKDGATYDVTGATVTCTIRDSKGIVKIADHSVAITDGLNGIVTLTLTDVETLTLKQPALAEATRTETHFADVKVVETDASITHCGPFSFDVRRAIT